MGCSRCAKGPPLPNPLLQRRRGRSPAASTFASYPRARALSSPSPPLEERVGERRPLRAMSATCGTDEIRPLVIFQLDKSTPFADTSLEPALHHNGVA